MDSLYQCCLYIEENVRLDPGCEYNCYHCLTSGPDSDGQNDLSAVEDGPVFVNGSLPFRFTTTTAPASLSDTQISWLLFSHRNLLGS